MLSCKWCDFVLVSKTMSSSFEVAYAWSMVTIIPCQYSLVVKLIANDGNVCFMQMAFLNEATWKKNVEILLDTKDTNIIHLWINNYITNMCNKNQLQNVRIFLLDYVIQQSYKQSRCSLHLVRINKSFLFSLLTHLACVTSYTF